MAAKIIRGEDAEIKYYLNSDNGVAVDLCSQSTPCKAPFPLTGCTGVSGEFMLEDNSWIAVGGYVVSEDLGIAAVTISKAQTALFYVGKKLKTQLILDFGGLTRKVQFDCALDVIDDITKQNIESCPDSSDIRFC